MTAFSLPRIQVANPPANADCSKDIAAGNSAADGGSFQQVLAQQTQKAKPEATAEKPAQPSAQNKPAEPAKNADAAGQTQTETTENAAPDAKAAVAEADALALLGLPAKDEAATDKDDADAAAASADQLPGLPATLPLLSLAGMQGQPKAVKSDAETTALPASVTNATDTLGQRGLRPQPHADFVAKKDLADAQHADSKAAELKSSALKLLSSDEHASPPVFAKLLADKELPAIPAVVPTMPNAVQTAAVNANVITPPLGSKSWDQAISQKVVWMVGGMEQSATLTLNPPDLGPLQVVIHVHNDQAHTSFVSDNPEVRQALQNSIDTLRGMLSNSGIQLGDTNISAGNQAQQQFQQASRQAAADNGQQQPGRQLHMEAPVVRAYGGNGLVDTFA